MLRFNIHLLRDHGISRNRFNNLKKKLRIPLKDPFCFKFSKKNKTLYYIAANHTTDKKSKTFKLIKNNIKKADLVIIEGIDYERGLSPNISRKKISEMKYASMMAEKNKILFSGVEPSDKLVIQKLIKNGTKKKDLILFFILEQYKVVCRNKQTEEEFNKIVNDLVIPYWQKILKFKKFDFHKYFEERIKEKFIFCETNIEIASPDKHGKYITNKIAAQLVKIRDEYTIKNLYNFLKQYDNIMIIYGQNHYYSHVKILENTFGKPTRCHC